jgi:hypothetical protein
MSEDIEGIVAGGVHSYLSPVQQALLDWVSK